ncbi:flagellar biosynthetic protein FliR [Aurantimonas sp. Leaf443]|uniref:flagellar biosynthetic protein FliR n=1 Tax=Aurantimonas sp. Leaf443 TaxID=1736378 RepID=UPI0006FD544D|nr:flagellar biosynthetic protein FliR [Aurantimonas sp. Leaf443]KQT82453.1 flagellar biosynthetic protein FliR [Aurantimonas sp. Leaf443]
MSPETTATLYSVFLIFCRVGACLMILPGYSSVRIPTQVRLFIAVAIVLAIAPRLMPDIRPLVATAGDSLRMQLLVTELLNGALIGLLGRTFLVALQFAGSFMANAIGMSNALGVPMHDQDSVPELVTLVTMTATVLIFTLNLHAEVIRALVASYGPMPLDLGFGAREGLVQFTDNLDETFLLCLRIASPFVVYAVIVNFAIGLMNKMTPQIPIYFISMPFVVAGGLVLLGYSIGDFLTIFINGFRVWVFNG